MPAKAPTKQPQAKDNSQSGELVRASFNIQYVANCAAYAGIYLTAVAKVPRNRPLTPYYFMIDLKHSWLLEYLLLSSCILHLISSTGLTTKVLTNPANAPFYIPSIKLKCYFFVNFLYISQLPKTTAFTKGTVTKGQYIPSNNFNNVPSVYIFLKYPVIVISGFICTFTLSVSKIQPDKQFATPDILPHRKSQCHSSYVTVDINRQIKIIHLRKFESVKQKYNQFQDYQHILSNCFNLVALRSLTKIIPIICFQFRPKNVLTLISKSSFYFGFLTFKSLYRSISTSHALLFKENVGAFTGNFLFIISRYMPACTSSLAFMFFRDFIVAYTHSSNNQSDFLQFDALQQLYFVLLGVFFCNQLSARRVFKGKLLTLLVIVPCSWGLRLIGYWIKAILFCSEMINLLRYAFYLSRQCKLSFFS